MTDSPSGKQPGKGLLYVLIAAVVILLIAVIALLVFLFRKDSQTPDPAPSAGQRAEASETQVVFRNIPADATLTADGVAVEFTYVGNDAVVARDALKDVCVVRAIAPAEDGACQTAAVWYNYRYGNDMTLGNESDYGAYEECRSDGLNIPGDKVVDVLTWAYQTGYMSAVNDKTVGYLVYSTQSNTDRQRQGMTEEINAGFVYDLDNYQAVCSTPTIQYKDGRLRYNATIVTYITDQATGEPLELSNHYTIELLWEDGMWKVNRTAWLSDADFEAGRYAALP